MNTINKLKEEIIDFLNFKKNKKFLILTDDDEDGLTSAIQIKRFIENNGLCADVYFNEKRSLLPGSIKEDVLFKEFFDKTKPDLIIFLDLNEDIAAGNLKLINDKIPIVIIDHHPSPDKINFNNPLFILKPQKFSGISPSQYSTTKVVYDFFDGDSIYASIGLIGDSAFKEWETFIKNSSKENNISIEELTKISDVIKLNYSLKGDKIELFNFVYKNGIKHILGSVYEKNAIDLIEHLKKEVKRFDKDKEYYKDIDLAFFKTEKGFASKLSNDLSKLYSHTLIVYSVDDYVKGSVRRNDYMVNCGELIKYAVKNASVGSGGGHIPAGGFACSLEYWSEFKNRAKEYAKKNLPKNN